MLKEHSTIVRRLLICLDAFLLVAAFHAAFAVRFARLPNQSDWLEYGGIVPVFIAVLLFNFYRAGIYHKIRYFNRLTMLRKLVASFTVSAALCAGLLFLSHATHYSRLLFLYFISIGAITIVVGKTVGKTLVDRLRAHGKNFRTVMILGRGPGRERLEQLFQPGNPYGLHIADSLDLNEISPERLGKRLTMEIIDEIYFAVPRRSPGSTPIDKYLEVSENSGRVCKVLLNINEGRLSKCEFARLEGLPLVVLHPVILDPDQILLKRIMDLAGAVVGLIITMMMFPGLAFAIKLDSPGPIFFSQTRVGQNGRRFKLYKFRSMYRDAEDRKAELQHRNELNGAVFKITDDPRITKVGRFIRKFSLDEFPQFWNVLTGDMSLVGTRPPTPDEVKKYNLQHYRRLSIKPGITGLWQVSGRNKVTDFDEIVKLDTQYIDQWSLWLDLKIIGKTFAALLSGK